MFPYLSLLPELCLDEGWERDEVEDEVEDGEGGGEGEVDGGVGPGVQQLVQPGTWVAVLVHQVVGPVDIP